jgi:hypothetical protein
MARAVGFSLASDHLSRHSRSYICGVCNCGAGFDFLVFTSGVWLDIASLEGLRLGEELAQALMHLSLYNAISLLVCCKSETPINKVMKRAQQIVHSHIVVPVSPFVHIVWVVTHVKIPADRDVAERT